jgi:hypothetical protein
MVQLALSGAIEILNQEEGLCASPRRNVEGKHWSALAVLVSDIVKCLV